MSPRRFRDSDDGFTLVEMLVSLTLIAISAALVLTAMKSMQLLSIRGGARGEESAAIDAAQLVLRNRIERLRPTTRFEEAFAFADVAGAKDQFTFIAPAPDAAQPAADRRYSLSRKEDGALVLSSTTIDQGRKGAQAYSDAVLLTKVKALELDYFGPSPTGQRQWSSSWSHQASPPQLVRVRVELFDRGAWPELVIRPAASVDTLCSLDAQTGRCRGRA